MNHKVLNNFFNPKSVAVIGASTDRSKIGGYIFSNLKKSLNSKAYPINIKRLKVQGVKAFKSVQEVESKIDLAIVVVPAKVVLAVVKDCVKAKIKNIIIISAGFREIGDEGAVREQELRQIIFKHKLNIIGPNCLGILNVHKNLNLSFSKDIPQAGSVACISQSGALIDGLIDKSFKAKIGFSKIISIGNMAGVDEITTLRYLQSDPQTKTIVMYMEALPQGQEFAKMLRQVSKKKPVIILKPGNSKATRVAIGSHTGSLAQDNVLIATLIKDNNGILVQNIDELYNILIGLRSNPVKNKNLAIVTNAGGLGVLSTDAIAKTSFKLNKLSDNFKSKLDFLPTASAKNNPIDILGDAKSNRYKKTLQVVANNKNINNVFVLSTPQIMTDSLNIAKVILQASKNNKQSVFACFLGHKRVKVAVDFLQDNDVAVFPTPQQALTAMDYINKYNNFVYSKSKQISYNTKQATKLNNLLNNKSGLINYNLTKQVLNLLNIKIHNKKVITSKKDINKIKLNSSKKYILKVDSDIIHKKSVGALIMDINKTNFQSIAKKMFNKFAKHSDFALTLEERVGGQEAMIGLKADKHLGNFLMFGAGGSLVEIMEDNNWATCPLDSKQSKDLIKQSKIYKIIKNNNNLINLVHKISYLLEIFPQIKEVDFNPVMVDKKNIYLVDVKIIV